jgi:hypothetical protein
MGLLFASAAAAVVASGAFLPGAQVALKNLGFAGFGYCG